MEEQKHEPISLDSQEVDHRFALFDPNNQFAALFEYLVPTIDREADKVATLFWASMRRIPTIAEAVSEAALPKIIAETAAGFRGQFVTQRDAAWCERISRHGDFCYDHGVPGRAAVAAITDAYDHLIAELAKDGKTIGGAPAVVLFARMAALENELVLTRINDRQKRDEEVRLANDRANFRENVARAVSEVTQLSRQVSEQSKTAGESSGRLVAVSQEVLAAAQQCAQAMANAAQECAAMLERERGITQQLQSSEAASKSARNAVSQGRDSARSLEQASAAIARFTTIISQVAGQTRLLSLNATIEAARAGELGRGFAVVAQEVKQLAAQAGAASKEVSANVEAMAGAVAASVNGTAALSQSIDTVVSVTDDVRRNISHQQDAISSITAAIDETALSVSGVSSNVEAIFDAAQITERDMAEAERSLADVWEN